MALAIEAKTVPQGEQRYPTVGDYWEEDGKTVFRISEMDNSDYEFLVLIHELIESYLCKKDGVGFNDIDSFDKTFESLRKDGDTAEPGDDINAPYYKQHQFASAIERLIALQIGVQWGEYDKKVNEL